MTLLLPLMVSLLSLLFGNDEAEIVFAGDAMMHQGQLDAGRRSDGTYDFSEYFTAITPYVLNADYAVVNLETPVSATQHYSGYPCFNAPESYVDALAAAGFDMFLTANNHTLDRHDRGLTATVECLSRKRLDHIGTYACRAQRDSVLPCIRNINGIKVGFVNYTYGTNGIEPGRNVVVDYIDRDRIRSDVKAARETGAEIIAACIHWGVEYKLQPHQSQTSLARFLSEELGVELVIGGHPHVVQPMHMTDLASGEKGLVVYSLGNFISNMKTRDTRGGAVVRVRLRRDDDGKVKVEDATYRLVYTEPADGSHNYRLVWADDSRDQRAKAFARAARELVMSHNTDVTEDKNF